MKSVAVILAVSMMAGASPVVGMNWEGHDDWMVEHPAAMAFGAAVPEARPVRREPACGSKGNVDASDNPYEQIPLRYPNRLPGGSPDKQQDQQQIQ